MNQHEYIRKIVKDICETTGVKQKYLAEQCGYSERQFCDLMTGRRTITVNDIVKLCKGLNKFPNELIEI